MTDVGHAGTEEHVLDGCAGYLGEQFDIIGIGRNKGTGYLFRKVACPL
jgi:hypothetical protein